MLIAAGKVGTNETLPKKEDTLYLTPSLWVECSL